MKIANLYKDMYILKEAQKAAFDIIKYDENMEKEENELLLRELQNIINVDKVNI